MVRGWVDHIMEANEQHRPLDAPALGPCIADGPASLKGQKVDIIGAGLAGTALALALHQKGFICRIWESRPSHAQQISSGVLLTPNGLRCLDNIGVFARIKDKCWITAHRTYVNDSNQITKRTLIANEERYGYKNHRIWRKLLLDEMKTMLEEQGVPITYDAKLTSIDSDDGEHGVRFRIHTQEQQQHTDMLIGADGIHSTVRKYLTDIEPEYTGVVGILSHIPTAGIDWPAPEFRQCTIQGTGTPIFMIPEDKDGTQVMVGMQAHLPTLTRVDRERLSKDKDRMAEFYRSGYDDWHGLARQIIDAVCASKEELFMWPYMRMPKLERWYSTSGNVVIAGDAAHALPPSSGQGVNQALEDVYALTLALEKGKDKLETLRFWQEARQQRIDKIFEWATNVQNVQRMSEAERERLASEGKAKNLTGQQIENMVWLYSWDIDQQVSEWAKNSG